MAESKPTKLQMAKEAQKLIDAAGNMSQVMDLDPAIKTDYLIDLKNKTVTVAHLQNVITNLQADIKRDASMIEPEDKFDPETHKVLADLNVKVPRPATKEEAVEDDEDEIEPTPSPPMVEETEEVAEKEKKNAAGTTEKITKEKDKFGFTVGSKASAFAAAIKKTPMTMKEIKEANWNDKNATFYNVFNGLKNKNLAHKNENGKMEIVS